MSETAICVENLSKAYHIGLAEEIPDTVYGAAMSWLKLPLRNLKRLSRLDTFRDDANERELHWALRDVSFEVSSGEVVGIIGHNGAGKSTLLKILSRITQPTGGRAKIFGRVSSLLEVGTGFHPELTGRENVYLNGTILGMRKAEIDRKFDEIVAFSGVEKFLDTPVKRYSSGMSVRLAFSVAAHLEPEILIIDEVLAVGDQAFQNRCLGRMNEVAESGRTVLFVSHNMAALRRLCSRCIVLQSGRMVEDRNAAEAIDRYLLGLRQGDDPVIAKTALGRVTSVGIHGGDESLLKSLCPAAIKVTLEASRRIVDPGLYVGILSQDGERLCGLDLKDFATCQPILEDTTATLGFQIPKLNLSPGHYMLEVHIKDLASGIVERIDRVWDFEVTGSAEYGLRKTGKWFGPVALEAEGILPSLQQETKG